MGVSTMRNETSQGWPLRFFTALVLPFVVLLATARIVTGDVGSGMLVRFVNSALTSFTLASFMLMVMLFVYGDRRKRPVAPFLGMLGAGVLGAMITALFLSQGDLLMEANGSVRAQMLSNAVRFSTSLLALMLAVCVCFGTLFATVMNRGIRPLQFEEE